MTNDSSITPVSAAQDFHRARRQAGLKDILARLTGAETSLLSYEEVRQKLKAQPGGYRGLKDIPLDAIIGSVGRYTDFTRDFLPRQDNIRDRWVRVKLATADLAGLPPIEVYQIGATYFIQDGNHRVSVARQLGATHIQAYVTEVKARVALQPGDRPDDVIIKAEYGEFLEATRLDELRPGLDLSVTAAGQYQVLAEHIQVHRYYLGLESQREIPADAAAAHWYDQVYLPVVKMIRGRGLLRDFPGRTETDLYLWLAEHRAALAEELGWEVKPEAAADHLAAQQSQQLGRLTRRIGKKLLEALTPDELEAGPPPGFWRRELGEQHDPGRLFSDILVPVNGKEPGWRALEQAALLAQREGARLHGLHVLRSADQLETPAALTVRQAFEERCQTAGIQGRLALASGPISRQIAHRSLWVDLMVVNLTYPTRPDPLSRLSSGFSNLLRRSATPVLVTPGKARPLDSALLAYDGSPKAEEALYIAVYLAGRWGIPLTVTTVFGEGSPAPETLLRAQVYLEDHGVEAAYEAGHGPVGPSILLSAEAHNCALIILGGYGARPVMEVLLGSTVDWVLRAARRPLLICR